MYKRARILTEGVDVMETADFQLAFNKWDNELVELMKQALEKRCRRINNDYIPFSPIIGKWVKRLNL